MKRGGIEQGRPRNLWKRISPRNGWHTGVSVLAAFKLDHLQSVKLILSRKLDEFAKIGNFTKQNQLKRLQMVQFECPRHLNPTLTLRLWEFHFPIFSLPLSGAIRIGLHYESAKIGNFREQNQLIRLQMVQFKCPGTWIPPSHSGCQNSIFPFSVFHSLG